MLSSCPNCGRVPSSWAEARQQSADLAVDWLESNGMGELTLTQHCVGCAPHGPVADIACAVCGEGPLLPSVADARAGDAPARVLGWLHANGWRVEPEPTCPAHLGKPVA